MSVETEPSLLESRERFLRRESGCDVSAEDRGVLWRSAMTIVWVSLLVMAQIVCLIRKLAFLWCRGRYRMRHAMWKRVSTLKQHNVPLIPAGSDQDESLEQVRDTVQDLTDVGIGTAYLHLVHPDVEGRLFKPALVGIEWDRRLTTREFVWSFEEGITFESLTAPLCQLWAQIDIDLGSYEAHDFYKLFPLMVTPPARQEDVPEEVIDRFQCVLTFDRAAQYPITTVEMRSPSYSDALDVARGDALGELRFAVQSTLPLPNRYLVPFGFGDLYHALPEDSLKSAVLKKHLQSTYKESQVDMTRMN